MTSQQEPFSRISVEKAHELYQDGDSVVVDVRQMDEWVDGHVKGAVHLPVDEVISRVDELPTGTGICCSSAPRECAAP